MNDLHLGILAAVTFLLGAASFGFLLAEQHSTAFVLGALTIGCVVVFVVRDRHDD